MEKTKVVLRKWRKDGGVVAILPEVPGDSSGLRCVAYDGVTHSTFRTKIGAFVRVTRPIENAKDVRECAAVMSELRDLGYQQLKESKFVGEESIVKLFSTRTQ